MELEDRPMKTHPTLNSWCKENGYDGVTKKCLLSAFNSNNPKIQDLAKKHKLRGIADGESKKEIFGRK